MELVKLDVKMMKTLWENTYRGQITDQEGNYVATARFLVNVPLPPDQLPENAPEVEPQIYTLIEDAVLTADDLIQFETLLSKVIRDKFQYEIDTIFFFYPSPEDALNQKAN